MKRFKTRYYRQPPTKQPMTQPTENYNDPPHSLAEPATEPAAKAVGQVPLVTSPAPPKSVPSTMLPLEIGTGAGFASAMNAVPQLLQIQKNNEDVARLREMPVEDTDGRWMSAWKALQTGLARAFDPRFGTAQNWQDIGSRLAYAGGAGLSGALNKTWNETNERDLVIRQKMQDNERLMDEAKNMSVISDRAADNARQSQDSYNRTALRDRDLNLREARQNFQQLNAEQKMQLSTILKRGFYKEGANKQEDDALAKLGIILPDFDTRKPIVKEQAGKFQQWSFDEEKWIDAPGMPVDESEVPIEYSVSGIRMKMRPRDVATLETGNQRQVNQQNFQRTQQEDQQNFQREMASVRDENEATNRVNQTISQGRQKVADGELSEQQFKDGVVQMINMFSEPLRSHLLKKFQQ